MTSSENGPQTLLAVEERVSVRKHTEVTGTVRAHTLSHEHESPVEADLSVETDGGFFTVNRGSTSTRDPANPFRHVHGAGFRAVYDLADLDNSRFVIATGQSGNIWSRHWGDLVELWRDGGSLRLAGDRGTLISAGAEVLTLTPRNTGTTKK